MFDVIIMKTPRIKRCIVPGCNNSSKITSEKIFVRVPAIESRRAQWFTACSVVKIPAPTSTHIFVCEDHFDISQDADNFWQYKSFGGKLVLKESAVPRYFQCQPGGAHKPQPTNLSPASSVRARKEYVDRLIKLQESTHDKSTVEKENVHPLAYRGAAKSGLSATTTRKGGSYKRNTTSNRMTPPKKAVTTKRPLFVETLATYIHSNTTTVSVNDNNEQQISPPFHEIADETNINCITVTSRRNISYQFLPDVDNFDLPELLYNFQVKCVETQTPVEIKKKMTLVLGVVNEFYDPQYNHSSVLANKLNDTLESESDASDSESLSDYEHILQDDDSDFDTPTESDYVDEELDSEGDAIKKISLRRIRYLCKSQSMLYIGVPSDCWYVVEELSKEFKYSGSILNNVDIVCIVLMKIRLNHSFKFIANEFGISESHVSKIFSKYTAMISDLLKELIHNPENETIYRNLPLQFYARYSHVTFLIDCLEVEIEKPSDPKKQALTWSEYKKANTLKYLLSCTPDGIVNFLSNGRGGRISDIHIVEVSGFLDILSSGMCIMADRGFKFVDKILKNKNCTLVRPPSVSASEILSPELSLEAKRIASLRSHVERCIRRVREFKMLAPHACLDIYLVRFLDECACIAAGLVNLQGPLIK